MSEPQHPQSEGPQAGAGRAGAVPQPAPGASYAPLDSLAAVGARLAQLREAKGWSVDDVAARLKVAPNKMRALEAGDISHLPGTTFALGVIRSYAKMLGTDPEPFAQALRRVKGQTEPDLSLPASRGGDLPRGRMSVSLGGTPKHHHSWWWGVAAGVVIMIALAMWHQGGDSAAWLARLKASAGGMAANPGGTASGTAAATSASAATSMGLVVAQSPASGAVSGTESAASGAAPAEASAPTITPLEPTQPSAAQPVNGQGASAPTAAQASATAAQASSATAQASPAAPASATSAAEAAGAAGSATLTVKVSQDSWFSVRDKNGKEVFSGLIHAGDTKEVSGMPPLKVTAGNRAGLESLAFDGQAVDAAKFGPSKGNVAHFTLP